MKKRTLLTLMSALGVIGLIQTNDTFAYTTDSITSWEQITVPSVSIKMNLPSVGDNNLDQINGLPSSTSFYKPVEIHVTKVKSYYLSAFLDCSALTGEDKTKCEAGNLLTPNGDTLKSVDSAKTFSTMNNEWGFRYNIGDDAQDPSDKYFAPLPTNKVNGYLQYNGAEQIRTDTSTYEDSKILTLGFGAKIDGNTAAGTYNGKITIAAVATPTEATKTISGITYMQQMLPEICTATPEGEYALQDTRDEKIYKVAKLKDNNCWMIQNLALDSGTTSATRRQLNSNSSDLTSGTTHIMGLHDPTANGIFSVYTSPQLRHGTHANDAYDNNSSNSGNYYNWPGAAAKNDDETNGQADTSICPKGWTLPSGAFGSASGQLTDLFAAYDNDRSKFDAVWHPGYTGYFDNVNGVQTLRNSATGSFWWTNTYYDVYNAQAIHIGLTSYSVPQNLTQTQRRNYGSSVRCVARTNRS